MKKFFFLTLFVSFFMVACSLNQDPAGSVAIELPAFSAETRGPSDSAIDLYEINLTGPTQGFRTAKPGDVIIFDSLTVGTYSLTIDGYDVDSANDKKIKTCEGKKENIVVESGDPTEVTVTLNLIKQAEPDDDDSGEKVENPDEDKKDDASIVPDEDDSDKDDSNDDEDDDSDEDDDKDDAIIEKPVNNGPKYDYDSPDYVGLRKDAGCVIEEDGELYYVMDDQVKYNDIFRVVKDGVEQTITTVSITKGAWSALGPVTVEITTGNGEKFTSEFSIKKIMKATNLTINEATLTDANPISVTFGLLQTEDSLNKVVDGVSQINPKDCGDIEISFILSDNSGNLVNEGKISGVQKSDERFSITTKNIGCSTPGEYKLTLTLRFFPKTEYRKYYMESLMIINDEPITIQ